MSKKLTIKEIEKMSIQIHGHLYNFSKFKYVNNKTPGIIICPKHGEFLQKINNHISLKQGCPICKKEKLSKLYTKTFSVFKDELFNVHGDNFIVEEVDYKGYSTKTKVVCKEHGEFFITPYRLINNKYGCGSCSRDKQDTKLSNREEFISKSKLIHGDKYIYDNVSYEGNRIPVKIGCRKHGEFLQIPMNHLTGSGCSKCNIVQNSKSEKEVFEFLNKYVHCTESNRKVLKGRELDIFIPPLSLGIEYNGVFWHSDRFLQNNYHLNKTEACESLNISLIHIFEDEWIYKKEIVKSRLLNLIGKTPNKIYARKCEIREVEYNKSLTFLNDNHIQGGSVSSHRIGLFYKGKLVSLMTFSSLRKSLGLTPKKGSYELIRFCNKLNTTVIGGASKLLKHFEKTYKPKEIISYADRRWSNGNLYYQLGFEFIHNSSPNYFYVKEGSVKRESRFKYRKDVLVRQGFNKDLTEKEIMVERGYRRIYDSGNKKFIKKY